MNIKTVKLLFIFCTISNWAFTQQKQTVLLDTVLHTIGENTTVKIISHQYNTKGLNLIVVHDDENTGVDAALHFIHQNGGRLTELQYGNVRYINFTAKGKKFYIDPNGMYTDNGTKKRLKDAKLKTIPTAINAIRSLGKKVLQTYSSSMPKYMITLHNNTEGYFNIHSYKTETQLKKTAKKLFINPQMDADDLVYVTNEDFFNFFKENNINVILESEISVNDGSLSKWASIHNIPYINIEIQHGHTEVQYKILCMVNNLLHQKQFKHLL